MAIDPGSVEEASKRILRVEREHLYGGKSGSESARRSELWRELDRVLSEVIRVFRKSDGFGPALLKMFQAFGRRSKTFRGSKRFGSLHFAAAVADLLNDHCVECL